MPGTHRKSSVSKEGKSDRERKYRDFIAQAAVNALRQTGLEGTANVTSRQELVQLCNAIHKQDTAAGKRGKQPTAPRAA